MAINIIRFYFICHISIFFSVNVTSTIVSGIKVKALSHVPVLQLEKLAQFVCMDLEFYIKEYSITSCVNNFWSNSHKVSSDPSAVQVKCQNSDELTLELPVSKHTQLIMLVPAGFEEQDIIYDLLQPEQIYAKMSTVKDVKYTIWSATLSDEGIPYKWTMTTDVLLYDVPQPPYKEYDVQVSFNTSDFNTDEVNGTFTWNSTGDNDLCFSVVNLCDKTGIDSIYIWPTTHPNVVINGLPIDDKCMIQIKGFYGIKEHRYKTPKSGSTPEYPLNMTIHATEDGQGGWNVYVSWPKQLLQPQRYNITLLTNDTIEHTVVVPGNASEAIVKGVVGEGFYTVSLDAIIDKHKAHTSRLAKFPGIRSWDWGGAAAGAWCALVAAATLAAALRCCRRTPSANHYERTENKLRDEEEVIGIESGGEDQWEVKSDRVLLHEVIGEGAFGVVRRGTLAPNGREVAVKMLKDFPSQDEVRSFRAEMELMKSVGAHPHVVSLLGCCSARRPLIVAEYCSRGDLLTYLRCSWDVMVSKRNAKYYTNNTDSTDYRNDLFKCKLQKETKIVINKLYDLQGICDLELTPLDLLSFCRQIAMGMEFLSSNRVVHRDLAARNILVTGDRTLKIADFGLSRDIYEENQYKQKGNGKMPVKWMALESLTRKLYTMQSDVWSFGVVIWEVVTLGGSPYPDVPAARLVRLLRAGYRMPKPINCSKQLYDLMTWCWRAAPRERPTFSELHKRLDELLNSASANQYITLELDEEPLPTPSPQRYIKMLIGSKLPWTRGESYERPLNTTCNHYTSLPVTATKSQS